MINKNKVVVIGDGQVGSSVAYTLYNTSLFQEIAIIDINKEKAEGDALDMLHGLSFVSPKSIYGGDYKDIEGASLIIITAGVAQKVGETRIDLLRRNTMIFDNILSNAELYLNDNAIVLVVSNPVDILTYYTYKKLHLPSNQIIGSGTVLDTARLKSLISEETNIDARNIHTYVLGEHGDSEVAIMSLTSIGGMSFEEYCKTYGCCKEKTKDDFKYYETKVKNAAYEIIEKKGSTNYAIALSVKKISEAIMRDENSILTISTYVHDGFNGEVQDVYFSLPVVVGRRGVMKVLNPKYAKEEEKELIDSAKNLRAVIDEIESKKETN